jgi:ATPase subunit of ABC transporter with duplicated ATPase domains
LEELLLKVPSTIVITHDRAFLDRITTRIIELDRGVLRSYPSSFAAYEERKEEELAAEDTARRRFAWFWKQEEAWIPKRVCHFLCRLNGHSMKHIGPQTAES